MGRLNSSVGSASVRDKVDTSAEQVIITLTALAKMSSDKDMFNYS